MLGVTGPNEYENNVNNNWYTSYLAKWCIEYALDVNEKITDNSVERLSDSEVSSWNHLANSIYFPKIEGTNIFLQQDGFLDKEQLSASDIPENQRPINQHWSWDRILRSIFIKQADVLQGIYLFEDHFNHETIQSNFDFYEPKTVHESSLSPCIHSILAAKIGRLDKAYELYLRTSRLDLDDYNHEADEGLHITSMAGTWMAIVEGMAGIRVFSDSIKINPVIPANWQIYSFQILVRNQPLHIRVSQHECEIINKGNHSLDILVYEEKVHVQPGKSCLIQTTKTSAL
jgi:maltose phosphorylase